MDEMRPRAGVRYPSSAGEFRSWFGTDEDCLDYLDWLRWPEGFVCPCCGQAGGWWVADGRYKCPGCGGRTSVTAGTLFDRRRTPLTVWFEACWLFASGKVVVGLSIEPGMERLWRARILAAHSSGNAAAGQEAIDRMLTITDDLGGDLEPETERLLAQLKDPTATRRHDLAGAAP